jgi:hypothetical protein
MRFTELRQEINNNLNEINSLQDYVSIYLTTSIQDHINGLNNQFVEHLFSDLTDKDITADIKGFLGSCYFNSNEYAKTCIHTVFRSKDIFGFKLAGWTDAALKCFDNFLLVLIQEKLKETINKRRDLGIERQKYKHLIDKGEEYYEIGEGFDMVYQLRNDFTHVEIINDQTGKRHQKPLSQKTLKRMKSDILANFKKGLLELEKQIL